MRISVALTITPGSALPAGVHSMAELMPVVLAAHSLVIPDDLDAVRLAVATEADPQYDPWLLGERESSEKSDVEMLQEHLS